MTSEPRTIHDSMSEDEYRALVSGKALDLTELSVTMTTAAGSGHPTSAASLAHLVAVLFHDTMRYDPREPRHPESDRLVLSEGHAVPIVYAAAADVGMVFGREGSRRRLTVADLDHLREIDSELEGHPHPIEGFPFFDAATGSLGQGLSVAAGLAAAARLDGIEKRIFCLIGDGEGREGQIWEAVDFIRDHGLTAVCPVFNANTYGQSDPVSPQQEAEALANKLEAYGFEVRTIDGHDPIPVRDAFAAHAEAHDAGQCFAIVARTVKGWGSEHLEDGNKHGKPVSEDDLPQVLAELSATRQRLEVRGGLAPRQHSLPTFEPPASPRRDDAPPFDEALRRFGKEEVLTEKKWATRRAYGVALRMLGHLHDDVVALDGDVKNSTHAEPFAEDPELAERYFEGRIAEQNLFSAAAGLAFGGKIAFASSFAKFITRAYDQIEMAVNGLANLKMVGSHSGISLAADGPSQMGLPDVAWFRAFTGVTGPNGEPAMVVLNPADAWAAYALTFAMARHRGPCYMRTLRPNVPFLYEGEHEFPIGGHRVVTEGSDLVIAAAGYAVHEARAALADLRETGIEATLLDLYCLPFDEEPLLERVRANGHRVLTVEDNYRGGIGSAVAEVIAGAGMPASFQAMHVRRIPKSGRSPDDLMRFCGVAKGDIVERAKEVRERAPVGA